MLRTLRTAAIAALLATTSLTAQAEPLSAEQRQAVQDLIHETLVSNPEILVEAFQALEAKEVAARKAQTKQLLGHVRDDLENDPASPVMGNPDGDVTIVEFFDYRCGYCKSSFATLRKLIEADGNIRLVLKEFPILGPESVLASRASMAVWLGQPDKYGAFHAAMMESRGNVTEDKIMQVALESGVDVDAMKKGMDGEDVKKAFAKTAAIAQVLDITGTPAFVIGDELAPGALNAEDLIALVAAARNR